MKLSPTMKSNMKGLSQSMSSKSLQHMKSMRCVQNVKITLLCGVMTLLVLRGALGRTSSIVAPAELTKPEIAVEFHEEEEKVDYWDPAVPFHLGPKISNWDKQRALWNRNHPGANATKRGTPRVLLVTGSQPKQCATSMGSFQLLKSLKNKVINTVFIKLTEIANCQVEVHAQVQWFNFKSYDILQFRNIGVTIISLPAI